MHKITKVVGRQVFDSRGNPTVEAEVFSNNISSIAISPSGASTGTFEAFEKRDIYNKILLTLAVTLGYLRGLKTPSLRLEDMPRL